MSIILTQHTDGHYVTEYEHEQAVTIGRSSECDMTHPRGDLSRRHAHVFPLPEEPGRWAVLDLGSKNGTYLNGEKVGDTPLPLSAGDVIRILHMELTVSFKE